MEAVSFVLLTNVVVRADPFQFTTEPETNFDPCTVSVKVGPPAVALLGEIEPIAGTGLLMVNVIAFDVPPPGEPFTTVTEAVPAVAMSAAEMEAVSTVLLEKVVVRGAPFQFTTEVATKPEPFTVSVKAAPPAVALLGEIEPIAGTGLLMVNVIAFDVPPPGGPFTTVTEAVPAVAMSAAEMEAVSIVLLEKVVARGDPFQFTTEVVTKPEPFTVSVKAAPPAVALLGEIELIAGTGFLTVNRSEFDVALPVPGFLTVTDTVPAVVRSVARICAVTWVLLTKVVTRAELFHLTLAPFTKFEPLTVRVKAAEPTGLLEGESEVMIGVGTKKFRTDSVMLSEALRKLPR